MKKNKWLVVSTAVVLVLLSGCGNTDKKEDTKASSKEKVETVASSKTKESTAESKTEAGDTDQFQTMIKMAQTQVPQLKKQFEGMYSDIKIEAGEGHTIVYTYVYENAVPEEIDVDAMKPELVKGLKPTFDGLNKVINDLKIEMLFLNPDQSEVAKFTVTQEDIDKIEQQ